MRCLKKYKRVSFVANSCQKFNRDRTSSPARTDKSQRSKKHAHITKDCSSRGMSPYVRAALSMMILVLLASVPSIDANSSGKTGKSVNGCGCHSTDAMIMPTMSGLPSTYTPGTTYSLSWTGSGMSGTGQGGFNLDASAGSWTNLGQRVQTQSGELTHNSDGQRSWTADWVAPSAGTGDVAFNLAVLYANGNSQSSNDNWGTNSWTVGEGSAPTNTPPVASDVRVVTDASGSSAVSEALVNQDLSLTYTFSDDDGDNDANSHIRWSKDGTVVSQYNDNTVLPSSATSVGEFWTAAVTPNDGTDLGTAVAASNTVEILDRDSDGDGVGDLNDAFPNDSSETTDSDGDGTGDNADVFPNDPSETIDSDGDRVGDNGDWAPNDASESADSDGDGVGNNADAFPNNPAESSDTDGDGVGDNGDAFPNDPDESSDFDGDGVGDIADVFPSDPSESSDADEDGVGDNADAFPNDSAESMDSDMDGVGDNADVFPNDATETTDGDGDGVGDNADMFPNDSTETTDSDGDGVGDNADAFPNDGNETVDADGDGVGDNADVFPSDATEVSDSDMDGVGDNADAFPNDPNEITDLDGDGVGDNADLFPSDVNETEDTDGDGVGDNGDAFPNDASETLDSDGDGVGDYAQAIAEQKAADDAAAQKQMITAVVALVLLIGGGVGGVMFMRRGDDEATAVKNFDDQQLPAQPQPVQQTYQQPVVGSEPVVLNQWTDDAGHTWRQMDDSTTLWWNGTDWQRT